MGSIVGSEAESRLVNSTKGCMGVQAERTQSMIHPSSLPNSPVPCLGPSMWPQSKREGGHCSPTPSKEGPHLPNHASPPSQKGMEVSSKPVLKVGTLLINPECGCALGRAGSLYPLLPAPLAPLKWSQGVTNMGQSQREPPSQDKEQSRGLPGIRSGLWRWEPSEA